MTIPDAAIEAAAEATYYTQHGTESVVLWMGLDYQERQARRDEARAALEAAMPAIREALAQEIEAGMKRPKNIFDDEGHYGRQGMADAARIVRGGTP